MMVWPDCTLAAAANELIAGDGDERDGAGGGELEAFGDVREVGGLDDAELGVGAVGEGEDAVADFEAVDAFAELGDDACDVTAEDGGEGYREAIFGGAGAHLPVDGIDADGVDAHEDFTGGGFGVGEVFVDELGRRTVFVKDNCFHDDTSAGLRCSSRSGVSGIPTSRRIFM